MKNFLCLMILFFSLICQNLSAHNRYIDSDPSDVLRQGVVYAQYDSVERFLDLYMEINAQVNVMTEIELLSYYQLKKLVKKIKEKHSFHTGFDRGVAQDIENRVGEIYKGRPAEEIEMLVNAALKRYISSQLSLFTKAKSVYYLAARAIRVADVGERWSEFGFKPITPSSGFNYKNFPLKRKKTSVDFGYDFYDFQFGLVDVELQLFKMSLLYSYILSEESSRKRFAIKSLVGEMFVLQYMYFRLNYESLHDLKFEKAMSENIKSLAAAMDKIYRAISKFNDSDRAMVSKIATPIEIREKLKFYFRGFKANDMHLHTFSAAAIVGIALYSYSSFDTVLGVLTGLSISGPVFAHLLTFLPGNLKGLRVYLEENKYFLEALHIPKTKSRISLKCHSIF